jgi:hypothetical protein
MKFYQSYDEEPGKHVCYFDIYDEIFEGIDRFQKLKILEIGVNLGAGLRSLKNYFPNSEIFGLDIKEDCKEYEEERIQVVIGSQVDFSIIENLSKENFDIIIDDGSHHNNHVFLTFSMLFSSLSSEKVGLYIIEDVHTSYWPQYGGLFQDKNSTIENFKSIIDMMHAWCIRDPIFCHDPPYFGAICSTTYFESWVRFVQFYENIIVVKKRKDPAICRKPL